MEHEKQIRQAGASDQNEEQGPETKHRGSAGWTALLASAGVASLGLAAATIFAPEIGSEATRIVSALNHVGLNTGIFSLSGALALGLAVVSGVLGRVAKSASRIESALESIDAMEAGMASLRTRVSRVHLEITVLQEANKTLLRTAQDQASVRAAGMQIDAQYRLAASMDQLGKRIEGKLSEQSESLGEFLGELSGSMLVAREQLEALTQDHETPEEHEDHSTELDAEAILPELPPEADLELEVSLEDLDDDHDDEPGDDEGPDGDQPHIDPAQFDWGAPPDPEDALQSEDEEFFTSLDSGLGLLDSLDDQGAPISLDDVPSLIPGLDDHEPARSSSGLNLALPEDPPSALISEDVLQQALQNARRRPID